MSAPHPLFALDTPLLVPLSRAAKLLGAEPAELRDPRYPVPKVDMRKAGAKKPRWMMRTDHIVRVIEARTVLPGTPNPVDR